MSNVVPCPTCRVKLRFPENSRAKSIRCPRCATSVALQPVEPQFDIVDNTEEEVTRKPKRTMREAEPQFDVVDDTEEESPRKPKRMRREQARTWVMGPAIMLIAIGGIGLAVMCVWALVVIVGLFRVMGNSNLKVDFGGLLISVLIGLVVTAFYAFLLFAGIQMVRLTNYVVAMIGCVLLILMSFCGFLTAMGAASAPLPVPATGLIAVLFVLIPGIFLITGVAGCIVLAREDVRRVYS